jgi:hypothetical protein
MHLGIAQTRQFIGATISPCLTGALGGLLIHSFLTGLFLVFLASIS